MAINFNIQSLDDWDRQNDSLAKAGEAMEDAAEALREQVVQNFANLGVPGDLTPIIMEKYDEEVLSIVQVFDKEYLRFVNANKVNHDNAVEMKSNIASAVGKMR